MTRDILKVDGVAPETKKQLQEAAQRLYGTANASLLVRSLIAEHLSKPVTVPSKLTAKNASETVRVELRLPRAVVERVDELAEGRFSARNYYLTSVILAHLGRPQLQGNEIEVLSRSNYELARIGANLNQVARAFNTLVKLGGNGKLPEIGKKVASLRREVKEHTSMVLRVLNSGTVVWDTKGRGQRISKAKK